MEKLVPLLAATLFLSFVVCCLGSALLQLLAWWRHSLEGSAVSMKALWKPEGHFDEVGLMQMRLAKRLILLGAVAYLSYGVLMFAAAQVDVSR